MNFMGSGVSSGGKAGAWPSCMLFVAIQTAMCGILRQHVLSQSGSVGICRNAQFFGARLNCLCGAYVMYDIFDLTVFLPQNPTHTSNHAPVQQKCRMLFLARGLAHRGLPKGTPPPPAA